LKKGTKQSASVSQIIRDYAEKNPGLGPTQIAKDLIAQGHKAYPALVSQALGKAGKKRKGKAGAKRGRKAKTATSTSGGGEVNLSALKAASDFIKATGSAENAIASIRNYQKLSSMFQ
jgi:hypothetical protein